jgi:hypothetical protein
MQKDLRKQCITASKDLSGLLVSAEALQLKK